MDDFSVVLSLKPEKKFVVTSAEQTTPKDRKRFLTFTGSVFGSTGSTKAGEPSCLARNGDLRAELVINLFWGGNLGELGNSYPPVLLEILRSSVDAQWQQYA